MKNIRMRFVGLILICFVVLFSNLLFGQEWSEEEKEVWAAVENWWQAWADGDINKIHSGMAEGFRGWRENFHAPYTTKEDQPWAERWIQNNKVVLQHLYPFSIDIHGDVAVVFLSYQIVLEQKDGSDKEEQGKWTEIYRKIDGKWLVIAETGFDISSSSN
jgi:ketosteroid isomerase-like protein